MAKKPQHFYTDSFFNFAIFIVTHTTTYFMPLESIIPKKWGEAVESMREVLQRGRHARGDRQGPEDGLKDAKHAHAIFRIICDAVFVLSSPKNYNKSREEIRELVFPLVFLENLKIANRRALLRALDIYATHPIDFSDAFLKATMEAAQAHTIYSYDTDFDRFSDIIRKEPEEPSQEEEVEERVA